MPKVEFAVEDAVRNNNTINQPTDFTETVVNAGRMLAAEVTVDLPATARKKRFEDELHKQQYYQRHNRQARKAHTKTRIAKFEALGIDVTRIKSCLRMSLFLRPINPQKSAKLELSAPFDLLDREATLYRCADWHNRDVDIA